MLPKDLLVVWKRKGNIKPKYLRDNKIAEEIIQIFREYQERKYKELQEKLEEIEGNNFKLVRGLSTLLERRCDFTSCSKLDGKKVRAFLFERGFVSTEEERDELLGQASLHFGVSKKEVEEAFFSDLQEEQLLSNFDPPDPEELVKKYNLSLTQTLLFDALELNFKVEGNYQQIFRQIKYLGLMYEINDGIKVTGPASLFKKNKKYGTSLAKLLPAIISAKKWKINAKIETKVGGEPRILNFELDSESKVALSVFTEPISHFDSEVEARFYHDFKSLNLGWEIKREPGIIKAGNYIVIPDFGFYKNGLKHYLEIVGFWTPEYLKKKISKLREAEANITVMVNENLNCKKEDFSGEVIFYDKKIPLLPIAKILKKLEEKQIEKEITRVGEIKISGDVVLLKDKAKELNVNPETLHRIKIPGYHVMGERIVSKEFLGKVKEEIKLIQEYEEVEEILNKHNLTMQALDYMGYRIIWEGLKPVKIVEKT